MTVALQHTASGLPNKKAADTIRILSAECVQRANSGHPGMPMGAADMAYVLWTRFLKHDPTQPDWPDRDRFVLSAGHGSMLLYSLLHLTGYELSLDELKNFRQWGSMTPGHPEYGHAPGVETTTGPLGQGTANAVGIALAEAMLAARFNTDKDTLIDHYTYAIVSDGDLMEGVASEACSLAGYLKLGKLVFLYDDNGITIEGSTELTFSSEDVEKRFEAYGWHTLRVDGHNQEEIFKAIAKARSVSDKPSIILAKTRIGFGSPNKVNTAGIHGSPLGDEELANSKKELKWKLPAFELPPDVVEEFKTSGAAGKAVRVEWEGRLEDMKQAEPEKGKLWDRMMNLEIPEDMESLFPTFAAGESVATRKASGATLNAIAAALPHLVGGSADLAPSTNTLLKDYEAIGPNKYAGRNLHFGVREHGMGGLLNGLTLHGGFQPYGATFLIFSDYMRPSVRLAALMKLPVVYVWTHDSVFLGEDGPTHQPIEQLSSLRAIPNLVTIRPSDATEVPYAWEAALRRKDGPTALILTRQGIPALDREKLAPAKKLHKGAYILSEAADKDPRVILMASGSEVQFALGAQDILEKEGQSVRVVAVPSMELFWRQDPAYRDEVLPPGIRARVAVEAGTRMSWDRLLGLDGASVTIDGRFGASAPWKVIAEKLGFTAENVAETARGLL
jgi:transketolase